MFVPVRDVVLDVADQGARTVSKNASHGRAGQDAEPGLDQVQRGGARGREAPVPPWMRCQPGLNRRDRVRRRVVHDEVQLAGLYAGVVEGMEVPEFGTEFGRGRPGCPGSA